MIWVWVLAAMAKPIPIENLPKSASLEVGPIAANNNLWFSNADYPVDLQSLSVGGAVRLILSIDETGVIYRCDIDRTSGNPKLDSAACDTIRRRGRFIPARDSLDRKIPSRISHVISFMPYGRKYSLPPDFFSDRAYNVRSLPNNKTSASTGIRQIIGADGKIESCSVASSSGIEAVDEKACGLGNDIAADGPMMDRNGQAVRSMRFSSIVLMVPPHP